MQMCKKCGGTGGAKCPVCKGTGRVGGGFLAATSQCQNCHGSGSVKCGVCDGKGRV